ncbi:MAG TPA: cbb3-type cytochrome c oxidase subunit I [Verrucomicrobiae bacterium]|jgi:cytochrome c oxidase cbb3-type subunit 1|nr:cbb3-type cytochrome c oxidase subunit I [Verrucomicrobiae bacterium]
MSAISSPSQTISTGGAQAVSPAGSLEIDASCRGPVLFLFLSALGWLLIGSLLGLIASLKFHAPNLLAECSALTYGRVHPAHLNALIYGFAAQAGLGVLLWITAHLSRVRLAMTPAILTGTILWNCAVTLGILGIFYGESTGYEWLEMPRYASATLFFGYLLIALGAMVTLHLRTDRQFYISQWFILGALFWFPWIYSTASLTLVAHPARGVLQTAIDSWYINNLSTIWFGFIGIATIFYFVPKISQRPLHSHYLGVFTFFALALFGSWGNIPAATPLPSWMPALSTMGALMTIAPILGVGMNVFGTICGDKSALRENRRFKFFIFATSIYIVTGLANAVTSLASVSRITNFTWFTPGITMLFLYGFFAMTMFGAMFYIVPRLVQAEFSKPGMICGQFAIAGLGVIIYSVLLAIGGVVQGFALNDSTKAFPDVTQSTLLFLRGSTLGELLMILANLMILLSVVSLLVSVGRKVATTAFATSVKNVEVIW